MGSTFAPPCQQAAARYRAETLQRQVDSRRWGVASLVVVGLAAVAVAWASRALRSPDPSPSPPVASRGEPQLPVADQLPLAMPVEQGHDRERVTTDDEVAVRVVHATTDEPIAGATVSTEWRSAMATGRGAGAATDGTGKVRLRIDPGVATLLHATAPGFMRASVPVVPEALATEVLVRLVPETVTHVRVVDAGTRAPIAGARVFAIRPHRTAQTRLPGAKSPESKAQSTIHCTAPAGITDAAGLATLAGVGSGFHAVLALADGFLAARLDDVELPPEPAPLEIALEPGHTIAISVHDEQGQPVVDREVTVVDFRSDSAFLLRTDADGRATSPGYAAGSAVRVHVARPELSVAAQFLETIQRTAQRDVVVPVAEPVRIVVPSHRGRAIDCVWEPGEPGDRLRLTLFGQRGAERSFVDCGEVPADRGRWQSGGCTFGEAFFEAVGTRSGLWRSELVVQRPDTVAQAVLTERVKRDASLTVVCTTPDGQPVGEALVTLGALAHDLGLSTQVLARATTGSLGGVEIPPQFEPVARARSDAAGRVHFPALLPGRHVLAAQHARDGAITAVVMVAGATSHALELLPAGEIRGRVRGRPPEGEVAVMVRAVDSPWRRSVATTADGTFTAAVAAGPYELRAHLASVSLDGSRLLSSDSSLQRLDVAAGRTSTIELVLPASVRRVDVSVTGVDPASHEVLAERVHPFDLVGASRWVTRRPIGRDGVARFERLEAEAAFGLLLVRRRDGRVLAQLDLERHVAGRVELRLPPSAAVTVQAEAVPAADVRLVPLHAHGTLLREATIAPAAVAGAVARFRDVPAGRYRLVAVDAVGRVRSERRPDIDVGAAGLSIDWR